MSNQNSLYTPYGAYELKATYQRNLMFGTLTMSSLVGIILLVFWIIQLFQPPMVVIDDVIEDKIDTRIKWPKPKSIIRDYKRPKVKHSQSELPRFGTPKAIDDDEEFIEENIVMATQDDIAEYYDNTGGTIDDGNNSKYVFDATEFLPKPDDFIPREIEPKFVHKEKPAYPRLYESAGFSGIVVVQVLVSIEGKVLDARIARSSGLDLFDQAALEAAYKNIFSPAVQNGNPVAVWVSYKVSFDSE